MRGWGAHPSNIRRRGSAGSDRAHRTAAAGGYGSTDFGGMGPYATMERPRSGWGRTRPKLPIHQTHSLDDDDDDSDEFSTRDGCGTRCAAPRRTWGGRRERGRSARAERSARSGGMDATEPPERLGARHSRVPARGSVAVGTEEYAETLDARDCWRTQLSFFDPEEAGCSCGCVVRRSEASVGAGASPRRRTRVQHTRRDSSACPSRATTPLWTTRTTSFCRRFRSRGAYLKQPVADVGSRRRRAERFTDNLSVKSYADSYSRLAKKY